MAGEAKVTGTKQHKIMKQKNNAMDLENGGVLQSAALIQRGKSN